MNEARPASTVVLVRTAPGGLEVFLVRRHDNVAFMGGAHVFPGGRVDTADHLEDTGLCTGADLVRARMPDVPHGEAIAFGVAAVRELFEEAGVLLARDAGGNIIRAAEDERFADYRARLMQKTITMRDIAERERVRLALDALAMFAHWVTPQVETRRFDTRFFVAIAPQGQDATHDDQEVTHGIWVTPSDAIEQCRRGEIALPPPTWTTLRALEQLPDAESAWRWAQTQAAPRVQPMLVEQEDGRRVVLLPGDPLHARVPGFEARETRFLLENGRWTVVDNRDS